MSLTWRFHCAICELVALGADGALGYCLEEARVMDAATYRQRMAHSFLVALVDRRGIFLSANQCMGEALRRPAVELVGLLLEQVFPPDAARLRRTMLQRALDTGRCVRFVDDSNVISYETAIIPIRDSEGTPDKAMVIAQRLEAARGPSAPFWKAEAMARMARGD